MPPMCRTCLNEISSTECISINDASLNSVVVKQELGICIPELDLNLVANAVVCTACVNNLHLAYDFKRKCLQTEERIRTWFRNGSLEKTHLEIVPLLDYSINNTGSQVTIKSLKEEPGVIHRESDELSNFESQPLDNEGTFEPTSCEIIESLIKTESSTDDCTNEPLQEHQNLSTNIISFPQLQCDGGYTTGNVTGPPTKQTATKRKTFTVEDKVDLIRKLESGKKIAELCRQTGLATSTLCCIMKNKDAILKAYKKNGLGLKRLRKPTHADVDEALLSWCKEQTHSSLNGPLLKAKSEELARCMGNYDFTCSSGWLDRFKARYNISLGKKKC